MSTGWLVFVIIAGMFFLIATLVTWIEDDRFFPAWIVEVVSERIKDWRRERRDEQALREAEAYCGTIEIVEKMDAKTNEYYFIVRKADVRTTPRTWSADSREQYIVWQYFSTSTTNDYGYAWSGSTVDAVRFDDPARAQTAVHEYESRWTEKMRKRNYENVVGRFRVEV